MAFCVICVFVSCSCSPGLFCHCFIWPLYNCLMVLFAWYPLRPPLPCPTMCEQASQPLCTVSVNLHDMEHTCIVQTSRMESHNAFAPPFEHLSAAKMPAECPCSSAKMHITTYCSSDMYEVGCRTMKTYQHSLPWPILLTFTL